MGFIDFTNGEVLTADQMDLVMRQGIMRFADASSRDTALSAVLAEGMMAYLDDTDEVLKYDGTDWIDISGDITGVTAGTALTGGGTSGDVTLDVDESALTIAQSQVTDLVSDLSTLTSDVGDKQDDVITTQGDIVIGDGSGDAVRLPVGSADQVLTSDGTTVSFQDAGGGGGLELISTTTLSGSSVTLSSIPQTFKHLKVFIKRPRFINGANTFALRINGQTSGYESLSYNEVDSNMFFDRAKIQLIVGMRLSDTDNGNFLAFSEIEFSFYTSNVAKKVESVTLTRNTDNATNHRKQQGIGFSDDLSAITQIEFFVNGSFTSGTIELYGAN